MSFVLLLLALAVVGVVGAVAAGRVTGGLDAPTTSRPYRALPADDMLPEDVDAVRFSLGLRGYRMDEVDVVLDRLRDELAERDRRIAALTERLPASGPEHPPGPQAAHRLPPSEAAGRPHRPGEAT